MLQGTRADNSNPDQLILDALKDNFWRIRSLAIERASKLKPENKPKAIETIKTIATSDPSSYVRSAALAFLVKNINETEMAAILTDRIEKDKSYMVVSTALGNLGKVNPTLAMTKAKQLENEPSSYLQLGIAQIYGGHAGPEAFPFFERAIRGVVVQGFDEVGIMNSFTLYNTRQDVVTILQAFPIYQYLKDNGDYYTKMFFGQNMSYFEKFFNQKIQELKEEVEAHEKNKDAVYADQTRLKIKQYEELKARYSTLISVKEEK